MSINVFLRLFAIGNEKVWKCSAAFFFRADSFAATTHTHTKISSNRKINFHLNDEKTATTQSAHNTQKNLHAKESAHKKRFNTKFTTFFLIKHLCHDVFFQKRLRRN